METIKNVSISELHSFRNHPFKVETNTELRATKKALSINHEQYLYLSSGTYSIISSIRQSSI